MASIRTYNGEIRICTSCGQPAYDGDYGWEHFDEQWDGIHCNQFPLADDVVAINWDEGSLSDLKAQYVDTHPQRQCQRA